MNNKALIIVTDTQIRGVIARPGIGGTFIVLANIADDYTGILGGSFADKEDFSEVFASVVNKLRSQVSGKEIPSVLYISVPNTFCRVVSKGNEIVFNRPTQIKSRHIRELLDSFNNTDMDGLEAVSKDILYYRIDDGDAVINVNSVTAVKIKAVCSVVGVSSKFCVQIPAYITDKAGFREIKFIPTASADVFLVPEEIRDAGASLIRSDFFATSVSHIIGDGTISLTYFDNSIGHIVNDLMESFSVDYKTAIQLLKESAITVNSGKDTNYFINGKIFPTTVANALITKHIKIIGDRLYRLNLAKAVYIVGGNIDEIAGVRNVLSNVIGETVCRAADPLTKQSEEPDTTINALLRYITCKM